MVKAITTEFHNSTHVLCTRHLQQNARQHLTDDGIALPDRKAILDKIFGSDGVVNATDDICFDSQCDDIEHYCANFSHKFVQYFQKRLKENLKTKVNEPMTEGRISSDWTNNNCESISHVLKQTVDWESKSPPEFVRLVKRRVEGQFKELRSALLSTGEFRLSVTHQHFHVSKEDWIDMTEQQRTNAYKRYRQFVVKDDNIVISTDERSTVIAPRTEGKKPDGVAAGCMLVIVLDTNPAWWGRNGTIGDKQLTLSKCVDSLMVFANSHLMMNHLNKLAFIAAHSNASHFLYPEKLSDASETIANGESHDGKYEMFDQMNYHVKEKIRDLVLNSMEVEFENDSLIAGAVSMALCYIHRMEKETQLGVKMSSRVLVVKASEDNPAQYMNLMNTIFTAQKQNVVIDACILDNDSGLVQQACDITGGVYLKVPQPQGLLQYLLWVYLPDPSTRERLTLPPRAQVDYRAACFCHRNLIDVGYVCSVCLSIFCTFSPICSTCQTTFKIVAPPKLTRKKSKKVSS